MPVDLPHSTGKSPDTLEEPIWGKTPKKNRRDIHLCITESRSCKPKTNNRNQLYSNRK